VSTALKTGTRLPDITLPAQDGSNRSLPDGVGPNLLIFYRGDW
jgi:peroxiredoxin